ncbi:proliferation-associated protein 2G4 [Tetranychus urticae]|uniref:Peptidase M24 domain-containing protein n=1 Tax=Tetranychus urticae TaxID=32264 RepID=T1K4E8_TETUR|nr:proliferation-associated protein 2G4 [Tetranychus urticae]XP_015793929.1 proliferation-associated protein 2G4 [Tetranychus urticae]
MADSDEGEKTIAQDIVVTKYKMAGEMVNRVLKALIAKCKADESVLTICELGDKLLTEETGKVFKKEKEIKKGIAFPTCVSVNNCICHFSPLRSDPEIKLKDGDVVKIDLGAYIDGFIAVAAHTLVVGASKENKVTGRKADVILAAHYAAEVALRLVKPGGENYAVTDAIQKVAETYNCKPVSGMLSHQLKQFRIDGEKSIIQNPTEAQRKEHEKCEFELHEVYAVDILISTGEGKGRELDAKVTVYKKTDEIYQLKMKASRTFFSEIEKKFGNMPFTMRALEDEKKARMGAVECANHKLIEAFNVLYEKEGEFVAQFKFTVLLMPSGSHKITGLPFDLDLFESEFKIEDQSIKSLLEKGTKVAKKKKKPGKSEPTPGGDTADDNTPAAED